MPAIFQIFFLFLLVLLSACQRPHVATPTPQNLTLPTVSAVTAEATLWPPGKEAAAETIIILSGGRIAAQGVSRVAQRLAAHDFQVLWIPEPVWSDSTAQRRTRLLHDALTHLAALPQAHKTGLLLLDVPDPGCPVTADSAFAAILYVVGAEFLARCCSDTAGAAARRTALGMIVPAAVPVTASPALLRWIKSPENLVWLATAQTAAGVMTSHLEPVVGRKAQLFFDRYLKGKR